MINYSQEYQLAQGGSARGQDGIRAQSMTQVRNNFSRQIGLFLWLGKNQA